MAKRSKIWIPYDEYIKTHQPKKKKQYIQHIDAAFEAGDITYQQWMHATNTYIEEEKRQQEEEMDRQLASIWIPNPILQPTLDEQYIEIAEKAEKAFRKKQKADTAAQRFRKFHQQQTITPEEKEDDKSIFELFEENETI